MSKVGNKIQAFAVATLTVVSAASVTALASNNDVEGLSVDSPFRLKKVWVQPTDKTKAYGSENDLMGTLSLPSHSDESQPQEVVKEGTPLAALIDKECARHSSAENRITQAAYVDEPNDSGLTVEAFPLTLSEDLTVDELVAEAEHDECVLGLTTDDEVKSEYLPNDSRQSEQKHLKSIEAEQGWEIAMSELNGRSVADVVVAVVDSGVDYRHPDLKNMMWRNSKGNHGYNFVARNEDPFDDHHHGTHVAGLVAAEMDNGIGVAGVMGVNSKIMAVKVTDGSGRGSSSKLANGIRYAADNGADVINISLGSSNKSPMLLDALRYAVRKGATVFAAAGNASKKLSDRAWMSPASYGKDIPGVISIGSTDAVTKKKSYFSNYSSEYVELAAPGSNGILSTFPGGSYRFLQGTSMASPVAAGAGALAIALMKAKGRSPSPAEVESALVSGSDRLSELSAQVKRGTHLNIEKLARSLTGSVVRGPAARPTPPRATPVKKKKAPRVTQPKPKKRKVPGDPSKPVFEFQ